MGWLMGFEPTNERVTVVCVNRFTTATIKIIQLARLRGFEPLTYGLEVRCSIQLSYRRKMVGVRGFEPPAPCSQGRCASQAALHPDKKSIFIAWNQEERKTFFIHHCCEKKSPVISTKPYPCG